MSKARRKGRNKVRDVSAPYSRRGENLMDLEDEEELNELSGFDEKGKKKEEENDEMLDINEDKVKEMLNEEGEEKEESRGKIQQRHKQEYKELRKQIRGLEEESSKLRKKDIVHRKTKKEITKQVKTLLGDMKERHERELREYDDKHKSEEDKKKEKELLEKFSFKPELFYQPEK